MKTGQSCDQFAYIVLRMFRCLQFVFLILIGFAQLGCGTSYTVNVQSTRLMELEGVPDSGMVYQLVASAAIKEENEVLYEQFASQVALVLNNLGFVSAADTGQDNPRLMIELFYGISNPIERSLTYLSQGYMCKCPPGMCFCHNYSDPAAKSTTRTKNYYVYSKWFCLTAKDLQGDNPKPAWITSATSTDKRKNLKRVFPDLVLSCEPYIATNTKMLQVTN